ncbi:hypothetical protein Tco_0331294 [Tanacetum coccineum]
MQTGRRIIDMELLSGRSVIIERKGYNPPDSPSIETDSCESDYEEDEEVKVNQDSSAVTTYDAAASSSGTNTEAGDLLALLSEEGSVLKLRIDLGPSSEETPNPTTDSSTAPAKNYITCGDSKTY